MTDRTDTVVAHVVRDFGVLTEPFVRQRIAAQGGGYRSELWYEVARSEPPAHSRRVAVPWIVPGTFGSHVFHRIPLVGPPLAGDYARAERASAPGVIHAHYATTGFLVGSVTSAPLVVSAYGFDISIMARRRMWRRAFGRLARRIGALLVEGPHMARAVERLGFAAEAIRIVRIGADLQTIAFRPPHERPPGPARLIACGRLVEKKGHDTAIRAFDRLRAELGPGATLEVVGGGPLESSLRKLVDHLGLSGRVRLLGAMPREDFLQRLRESTLFLAPSRTAANGDSEGGAPTTILDAQAAGTIVVASRHADIPFLIEDGRTGYLAPEADEAALAARIAQALADRARWPVIAATARQAVLSNHGDEAVSRAVLDVYADVRASQRRT